MNKGIVLILFFFLLSSSCYSLEVKNFVSFPGEKAMLEFDSAVSVEMEYYYSLNQLEKCSNLSCPVFENKTLSDSGKKSFVLDTANSEPGFYALKVSDDKTGDFYYTSLVVRPDYRFIAGFALVVLTAVLVLVEKNVFRK